MDAHLIDSTLREGAQATGRYLSDDRVDEVLDGLARSGVAEAELGHVVAEPGLRDARLARTVRAAREVAPGVRRLVWCRARREDLEAAGTLRADGVAMSLPVSDRHLTVRLHRDRAWALGQVAELVRHARAAGVEHLTMGLEDATRADPGFLEDVAVAARAAGVDRLRVADTVGIADPATLVGLLDVVRSRFDGPVGVHVHDDFGLATASTVAALQAGAAAADVSLLGLGERAGIARTEQVAAWLAVRSGHGYDLAVLTDLCRRLATWVDRPIARHAPVIGRDVFAAESGLHVAALLVDPALYEPFPPSLVGASRRLGFGRSSGRAAVAGLIGVDAQDGDAAALAEVTELVRREATRLGRALDHREVLAILETRLLPPAGRFTDQDPDGTARDDRDAERRTA